MKRVEFVEHLLKIQAAEIVVSDDGQKEYAHDADNCFANFDSDADHGVSRLQSIATHLNKHMRGIKAFVNGHRSQREDIRGRIKDARLYLALLWAAIEDEERREKVAMDPRAVEIARASEAAWAKGEQRAVAETPQIPLYEDGWAYGADPLDDLRKPLYVTPPPLPVLRRKDDIVHPDSH